MPKRLNPEGLIPQLLGQVRSTNPIQTRINQDERIPMCCFTRPVEYVRNTRIFARDSGERKQFLVYEMDFASNDDLAMVLPLPVPPHTKEDAVRFISLKRYPVFFTRLASNFPPPRTKMFGGMGSGAMGGAKKLAVVDVGSFEASFVPTIADFDRLDEKFRLPQGVWDNLPQYAHSGFAVFKFKKNATKIHPMAFEFPRTNQAQLFFPTVHVHDGEVHDVAEFDHSLYAQFEFGALNPRENWTESQQPAGMFLNIDRCQGLVDENSHVYKKVVRGLRKNEDLYA